MASSQRPSLSTNGLSTNGLLPPLKNGLLLTNGLDEWPLSINGLLLTNGLLLHSMNGLPSPSTNSLLPQQMASLDKQPPLPRRMASSQQTASSLNKRPLSTNGLSQQTASLSTNGLSWQIASSCL